MTHSSPLLPFYDPSIFKYKMYFQGFFLPDDYSLDLKTLQVQQSQDPVLRTVHSWISRNEKPEFLTLLLLAISFCTHITKDLNNFSSIPLLTSYAFI